jgi:hypothetical protein
MIVDVNVSIHDQEKDDDQKESDESEYPEAVAYPKFLDGFSSASSRRVNGHGSLRASGIQSTQATDDALDVYASKRIDRR